MKKIYIYGVTFVSILELLRLEFVGMFKKDT